MHSYRVVRIFIDLSKLRYPNTGLASVCRGFLYALAKQDLSGLEIDLLVPSSHIDVYRKKWGQKFRYLPYFPGYKLYFYWYKYNLLHIPHQDFSTCFLPNGLSLLFCVHDLNFLIEKTGLKSQRYLNKMQRNIRRAQHISTISEATKQVMLENLQIAQSIAVIYNGTLDLTEVKEAKIDNLPPSFILSIGVIYPKKCFEYLIRMLAYLPDQLHLVIIGSGEKSYRRFLEDEVGRLELKSRIHFTGGINESMKATYLKYCQAYISVSKAEGFGLPILEAFNYGKPVFLSKISAHQEIGTNLAYYFESLEPREMANFFLNNIDKDNEYKSKERLNYIQKFSWELYAQKYLSIYRSYL